MVWMRSLLSCRAVECSGSDQSRCIVIGMSESPKPEEWDREAPLSACVEL